MGAPARLGSAAGSRHLPRVGIMSLQARRVGGMAPAQQMHQVRAHQHLNQPSSLAPVPVPRVPEPEQSRGDKLVASAAASAGAPAPAFKWGANMKDLSICVGIAAAMWFVPPPAGVSLKAWHLLSVFTGTIVGIITTPLPLGAVAVLGLGAAMLTKVLTFAEAFSAFASEIP
jgi:hypothetical protein